ncbi:hypothetical protein I6G82_08545 [Lysinibacillus macroides]|uniref:Uncharacterized protein n=1 Tax=Lysinibacillus macroides TaxID=33935 RepID=A0A0M9DJ88_9BACI|nr:hypothetical protein [Lysinibacillus macroides]KOY81546.1 hypothetical protein ADM90_14145 [Lysinibacillus macroides]QPR69618.1 hypothetical protein I6G82_08545 [Lysinibacillus macroides]
MEQKSSEELLRQQLQILAERSANEATVSDLPQLTLAMVKVYEALQQQNYQLDVIQIKKIISGFLDKEQVLL